MSNVSKSVECNNCGMTFYDLDQPLSKDNPCPNCGSFEGIVKVGIKAILEPHGYLGGKMKKPTSKHKKKRADYEFEQGVTTGKNGKLVYKRKVKDREHAGSPGSYVEYVRDKDGNIIVNKSEKLSEHKEA